MRKLFTIKTGLIIMSMVCLLVPLASCSKKNIQQWNAPPAMQIDEDKTYYAVFDTSLGTFKIELWAKDAPQTVNNFVFLAEQKFYDDTVFHRIKKYFMIQGGDPTGTGTGGPGYAFPDELPPKGKYEPGVVAMANFGPDTNGSQFFICVGYLANDLPKDYTQFGKVVEGMDVVEKLSNVEVAYYNGKFEKPKNPPTIKSVTITES